MPVSSVVNHLRRKDFSVFNLINLKILSLPKMLENVSRFFFVSYRYFHSFYYTHFFHFF